MPISLDVPFKGQRTYLHSTDIFNALVAHTGVERDISLRFNQMLTTPIEAVPASEVADAASAPARFAGTGPRGAVDLVIRPTGIGEVTRRVPYDEEGVVAQAVRQDNWIEDSNAASATPIERIVALQKRLIAEAVRPKGKLLFISIQLKEIPSAPKLRLEIRAKVGTTIYRSAILAADRDVGNIVFYGA